MTAFVSIANAAKIAGLSPRHFRRHIDADRLQIAKINGKFFLRGRDLEAWLENRPKRRK